MNTLDMRTQVLRELGATDADVEALLAYNQNVFDLAAVDNITSTAHFPLPDEPFVDAWRGYLAEAEASGKGIFETLRHKLIQFQFPIQEGISQTDTYRAATLRGTPPPADLVGIQLNRPEALQLRLHATPAGHIPVLLTADRTDFVTLVRALTLKNEPANVPDSQGAAVVSGYNNWDRVRAIRTAWETSQPQPPSAEEWQAEFANVIPQKERYQDRFILLSDGPYSAVQASQLGLSDAEWRQQSVILRRDHECAHYFTRRVFSSMRNNLIDEIIADYAGLVGAIGHYRADWFLRFVGLEAFPAYREGGRLQNYRGKPPLSDSAFDILKALVKRAAENLERFDTAHRAEIQGMSEGMALMIMSLIHFTLEELAAPGANHALESIFNHLKALL